MNMQSEVDGLFRAARAKTFAKSDQLTLGELILKVEVVQKRGFKCHDDSLPQVVFDFGYFRPTGIDSWRGSYCELALNYTEKDKRLTIDAFSQLLLDAVGKTFEGYKGGDFLMTRQTPVWVANYGESPNTAVVNVHDCDYEVLIETGRREFVANAPS